MVVRCGIVVVMRRRDGSPILRKGIANLSIGRVMRRNGGVIRYNGCVIWRYVVI